MKFHLITIFGCAVGLAALAANADDVRPQATRDKTGGGASTQGQGELQLLRSLDDWPDESKKAATAIVRKYGMPDEVTETRLIWIDNGPWKETIIYREPVRHLWPIPHKDVLEQFVDYRVPPEKFTDLARYDGSVIAERTKGVLSARCDKEEMNFLALNLADKLVSGDLTVDEARRTYTEAAMATMRGNPPPIVRGLQFEGDKPDAGDPDMPAVKEWGKGLGK